MPTLIVSDALSHLMRSLGWTLIHSLWQAAIAGLIALVVLWMTGKSKPSTRYNILLALFMVLVGFIFLTFFIEYQQPGIASSIPGNRRQINQQPTEDGGIYLLSHQTGSYFSSIEQWINAHIHLIVACWFLACCIQTLRLFYGAAHIRRLKTSGVMLPGEWTDRLEILRTKLHVTYPVVALESVKVKVPVVAGFLKPFILLPFGMLSNIPFDQVESILLHELAHIRRRDYLVNALQVATESVLFFNPALMWISSLIREEREACCDAIAVNELKSSSMYVEALVTFQAYSGSVGHTSLAFAANRNYLLKRVKRILYNENKKINVMEKMILFAGLAAVCMSPVIFSATAKPVAETQTVVVQQASDTLPPANKTSNKNTKVADRRAAKHAARAAKQAEKKADEAEQQMIKAEKAAAEAEEAAEAYEINPKVNVETNTDVNVDVDEKLTPEIKLRIDKAVRLALKNAERSKIAMRQADYHLQQTKIQQELNMQNMKHQMQLVNEQMRHLDFQKSLLGDNNELNGIINFLMIKNIIRSKENLSFRLDNETLTVNDVKQPESLHNELKEKYISDAGDYYEYKNSGSSTNISIRHND
jgi:beta-lactamase regulating signal transducer with metallopeptidase domain